MAIRSLIEILSWLRRNFDLRFRCDNVLVELGDCEWFYFLWTSLDDEVFWFESSPLNLKSLNVTSQYLMMISIGQKLNALIKVKQILTFLYSSPKLKKKVHKRKLTFYIYGFQMCHWEIAGLQHGKLVYGSIYLLESTICPNKAVEVTSICKKDNKIFITNSGLMLATNTTFSSYM